MIYDPLLPQAALMTVNAGSSSIKFAAYRLADLSLQLSGHVEGIGGDAHFHARSADGQLDEEHRWTGPETPHSHAPALRWVVQWMAQHMAGLQVVAVGHRVVHGGPHFSAPVRVDEAVMAQLQALQSLAPLHQPHNLAGIRAAQDAFGDVPQVACFDTAFHHHPHFVDDCYALPRALYDEGVRRYGFHGLSYEYIARALQRQHPAVAPGRVVVAHLGNGASMCAMQAGRSVASSMGFSALDGLPMGTRCGQIDPGVLLYLLQHKGLSAQALSDLLYKQSGLLGLSGGLSNDMRTLEAAGTPEAEQAIAHFVRRVVREVGALAALLGGLDALVFTGGIGEHSSRVRGAVLHSLAWMGVRVDEACNRAGVEVLSTEDSGVLCLCLPTNEEGMLAQHTAALLHQPEAVRQM